MARIRGKKHTAINALHMHQSRQTDCGLVKCLLRVCYRAPNITYNCVWIYFNFINYF